MPPKEQVVILIPKGQDSSTDAPYGSTDGSNNNYNDKVGRIKTTTTAIKDDPKYDDLENLVGTAGTITTATITPPSNEYVLNVAFFTFVGFLSVQVVFAMIAHSQSMLADSEAMAVDAVTYLFNLLAERMKNQPLSAAEQLLSPEICSYQRQLRRLYLELIPPALSVGTLICVTIYTLREAITTLWDIQDGTNTTDDEDVSVVVMLIFSSANLVLDFVNVTCFVRSHALFGLDMVKQENATITTSLRDIIGTQHHTPIHNSTAIMKCCPTNETTSLLVGSAKQQQQPTSMVVNDTLLQKESSTMDTCCGCEHTADASETEAGACDENDNDDDDDNEEPCSHRPTILSNLNMCSAWTVCTIISYEKRNLHRVSSICIAFTV